MNRNIQIMKRNSLTVWVTIACLTASISACKKEAPVIPPPPDSGETVTPPVEKPKPNPIVWKLDFEDSFNGTSVNTSNWSMYNSSGHAGHGLRRPDAFSVKDGNLVITAQMADGKLVSGGMRHRKDYLFPVRFEFRAKCEKDPSLAMSGVVLTWPKSGTKEENGELDIFETGHSNASRKPFSTFIHYRGGKQVQFKHEADASEWQEMAMDWYADSLVIWRDSKRVWKLDKSKTPDTPHHICLQLDAFKDSMTGVCRMYVDYVRIYKPEQ